MLPTRISDVAAQAHGRWLAVNPDDSLCLEEVRGVCTDNRTISPGDMFVAIAGERVNGNDFAADALARGAAVVMSADPSRVRSRGVSDDRIIAVEDVYQALGCLAREQLQALRESAGSDFTVVAVTGSVGKTTTKDLLSKLLSGRGEVVAPPGSFNNELGLPLTVLRATASTATLVLEMGAGAPGDIAYLTSIAPPDLAVVLIVARAHLGFMGGIEAVAQAKQELVEGLRPHGVAFLNAADPRVAAMSAAAPGRVVYFGAPETEVNAERVWIDEGGHAHFVLHTPHGSADVSLKLVGEHHVLNALAAASVADYMGVPIETIAAQLSATGPLSAHRMNVKRRGDITIIDDSYNANPDSMRAGLKAASDLARGRRIIAVLGQMAELGQASGSEHYSLGSSLARYGVVELLAVGESCARENLAHMIDGAQKVGVHCSQPIDPAEAPTVLRAALAPGDVVLIKGSHSSGAWRVAQAILEEDPSPASCAREEE